LARDSRWSTAIDRALSSFELHPVLVDIGASGPPRDRWDFLARHATFVGFDPDLREMRELTATGFHRAVMLNEAVTAQGSDDIPFYLTNSPYCSSTLEPDLDAIANYSCVDSFRVEQQTRVKATSLESVLSRLGLDRIDWFKVDSQGTDLRLFNSIPGDVRDRVLCVEVEPGLIDVYKGEDLFVDAHRDLIAQGFWLSEALVCGTARIRSHSIQHLRKLQPLFDPEAAADRCPMTPGWIEATYLRSIEHLDGRRALPKEYCLLWAFALVCRQWGFALDVALAYEKAFGRDATSVAMRAALEDWFTRPTPRQTGPLRAIKSFLPTGVKRWIKSQLLGKTDAAEATSGHFGGRFE
jgi:hypothetical protein